MYIVVSDPLPTMICDVVCVWADAVPTTTSGTATATVARTSISVLSVGVFKLSLRVDGKSGESYRTHVASPRTDSTADVNGAETFRARAQEGSTSWIWSCPRKRGTNVEW